MRISDWSSDVCSSDLGAINITSRRPDNDFGGYVQLTTGRFGRIDATARVDIPLSDSIRTAVSFASLNRDGYYRQLDFASGREVGRLGDINALTRSEEHTSELQ